MLKHIFGKNMKRQRKKLAWSQEEAAYACQLSTKYWGKLERGTAAASIDVIEKVTIGMGVDIEELLKDSSDDEQESPACKTDDPQKQ